MKRGLFLALVLLSGVAAGSPLAAEAPQTISPSEQAQLDRNLDRGTQLFRFDQAAWHVTDAALAAISDPSKGLVRGYITTSALNDLKTTFFGENGGNYYALFSAVWTGSAIIDAKIYPPEKQIPVTPEEQQLIEARKVAIDGIGTMEMCSSASPNVIVLPGASADDPVSVYVLTPQTKSGVFPLGGHHRIDVKGGKIVAKRDFTKSCINFDKFANPKNERPEAVVITHLLDSIPTEIHVFSVYALGIPLFVGVQDGRIYAVEIQGGRAQARLVQLQR